MLLYKILSYPLKAKFLHPLSLCHKKRKKRKNACSILRFVRVLSFYLVICYYTGVCEIKTNARDSANKRPKLVYSRYCKSEFTKRSAGINIVYKLLARMFFFPLFLLCCVYITFE